MPFTEVMSKFKSGNLHSGSKEGPKVKSRSQAVAILLKEKAKADAGDTEYQPKGKSKGPAAVKGLKSAKPSAKSADADDSGTPFGR